MMQEYMPLSLKPLDDPNFDPGEHQVMDAETAYILKIVGSRERAEDIVRSVNALPGLMKALEEIRTSICGYNIRKTDQYPETLALFNSEVQRMDRIARNALASLREST